MKDNFDEEYWCTGGGGEKTKEISMKNITWKVLITNRIMGGEGDYNKLFMKQKKTESTLLACIWETHKG